MSNDKLAHAVRNLIEAQRAPGGPTGGFVPKRPSREHERGVFLAWQEVHAALANHEAEKQATPVANDWRRLALQFDGQRMAAMAHLQMLLQSPDHADAVRAFLDQTPSEQIASVRTAEKQAGPVAVQSPAPAQAEPARVTTYNVGRWCKSEDECIAAGIDFSAYERGVADAADAFARNRTATQAPAVAHDTAPPSESGSAKKAARWDALTEPMIDEFLEDYEMIGEAEDGRDACYAPSDKEKHLIKDAIMGLLQEAWDRAALAAKEQGQ